MNTRTHAAVMLGGLTLAAGLTAAAVPAEASSTCEKTPRTGTVKSFNSNRSGGVIAYGSLPPAGTPGIRSRPLVSFTTKQIKPAGTVLQVGDQVRFIKCVFPAGGGPMGQPAGATDIRKITASDGGILNGVDADAIANVLGQSGEQATMGPENNR